MALLKSKSLPNGSDGNYWKIIQIAVDRISLQTMYIMALFKDQTHAHANAPHLGLGKKYAFQLTKDQMTGNMIELGYVLIKAKAASLVDQLGIDGKPNGQQAPYDPDLVGAEDS